MGAGTLGLTLTGRLITASAMSAIATSVTATVTLLVTATVTLLVTATVVNVAPRPTTTVAISLAADGSAITAALNAPSGEAVFILAADQLFSSAGENPMHSGSKPSPAGL